MPDPRRVLINDVDAAGVVFFARAMAIAHEVYEQALYAAGLAIDQVVRDARYALPLVKAEAEFAKPLCHGDLIEPTVVCERIGGSSYLVRIELRVRARGEGPCMVARQTHVCLDLAVRASRELPDEVKAALGRLT
jgi:1,4-dihydroxy-2-naphthoyl-CoA hydrolase